MNIFRELRSFRISLYPIMLIRFINMLLLTVGLLQNSYAQYAGIEDLKFENYTPPNGLPSDFIETITQDKYGFIWLGTHNGLLRFDGVQFKTYLHDGTDSNSLPDNDARFVLGDSTGKIWITSRKGLFYFNYAHDNFSRVVATGNGQPINFSASPVLDKQNRLWFYANAGICRMDPQTLAITIIPVKGIKDFPFSANRLFSTRTGNVWLVGNDGLYFFDDDAGFFQKQAILNDDGYLLKQGIQNIFEESKRKLWIASFYGLYLLDRDSGTIQKFSYVGNNRTDAGISITSFGYCLPLTGDSIFWCTTPYEGLLLFNMHTKKFIKSFRQDHYDASSIGGSLCYWVFSDRDNIIWSSHINGLSKLDWHSQQIKSYRIKEMTDSNSMMPIRKIIADKNSPSNYWLITWNYGVLHYNKNLNKITKRYRQSAGKGSSIFFNYDGVYDNHGVLWIGSETGLCYYDQKRDQFINIKPRMPVQSDDTIILKILKDDHNNLWLGTNGGLWEFNITQNEFKKYRANNDKDSGVVNSSVYTMCFDHNGRLYVGTHTGLYILDTSSGKITAMLRPTGNSKTDFNINYIWGIDVDKENNAWVATRGGGLYKFNPLNNTYTDFKFGNGLTTEEVRDVFVDSLQRIWVSSFDGVFKLDQRTNNFTRYTPEDGLDNFNVSLGRWSVINNKIYSGSPGAYSIIDPYARKSLTSHFPVWITGIKILNRSVHFSPDSSDKITILVNYTENVINFEFAAISYTASSKIKYAYLLEGFDKEWHFAENLRVANYNNLAGGGYTFKVKAMNAEGLWSDRIASVRIQVKPAFWETWWFRLVVAVILAAVIGLLVKKRISNIRKEAMYNEQRAVFRQKLAETEMMALRAQMNPHFIFNCMNIIDGLITDNRKEEAQDFLQKFSKLIRLVLENSQYQLVPLHQDIEALKLYVELEAVRYSHYFKYKFDIDPELIEANYKMPPLLLQPYVENAIVHGLRHKELGEGLLYISMKKDVSHVSITIEDNGVGRSKAKQFNQENKKPHQPIGMNVTGKRIDLLRMINSGNVDIHIMDLHAGEETGTRVTIHLPIDFKFG